MLHEVLLALSGHPSPLFDQAVADGFPMISPAESTLLASIGRLATIHRALKSHLSRVSTHHPSLICRAVAASILASQISKFQDSILDVEQQILTRNASTVGAYDIVPLAGIVSNFEPWKRRFDWYWELACFIYPADATPLSSDNISHLNSICTGRSILDRLRSDAQTGYPDVEEAAMSLLAVAERMWLRQLSAWLLSGTTPRSTTHDFFVCHDNPSSQSAPRYSISANLIPAFVTREAAASVLFVGKTLGMSLSESPKADEDANNLITATSDLRLEDTGQVRFTASHVKHLACLRSPISPTVISSLITNLRSSVASKVVDEMLPIHLFMKTLYLLRRFLLAGRGDFTDAMISESDKHIASRHQQALLKTNGNLTHDLAGVMMKEGEVGSVLARTWSALAPAISKEETVDEEIEWAREHMSLALVDPDTRGATQESKKKEEEEERHDGVTELPPVEAEIFEDLLLSIPTSLYLRLDSAYHLFLGKNEVQTYSRIHTYLLAIRRAHNHLSGVWRQTPLRRDHPAPIRRGRAKKAFQTLRDARRKRATRMNSLRSVWSTCNRAVVTLAGLGEYIAGEVIERSWNSFNAWAFQTQKIDSLASSNSQLPRDPELLSQGHKQFLAALVEALLLNDKGYTKILRSLFIHIDQLVAFMKRLENVQRDIDLRDEGVMIDGKRNYDEEEHDVHNQLARSSKSVASDLTRLIDRFSDLSTKPKSWKNFKHTATGFEPHQSRTGIDHLLMRLDFGSGRSGSN